jgi:hypothetical protein
MRDLRNKLSRHGTELKAAAAVASVFVSFNDWYPHTIPGSWSQPFHIKFSGDIIDKVRSGELRRVCVRMPPRHGKTETWTIRAIVRDLLDHPEWNILITAHTQRYANRISKKVRTLARQMGVQIDKGAFAVDEWYTTAGGVVSARGVGSPPTGIGYNRIYIDDPVKSHKQVESETQRDDINEWYFTDILQRLEPDAAIVLVMTQWHPKDLSFVAVDAEPGEWLVVRLPGLAEEGDVLGRQPGEALWPERYSVAKLEALRKAMSYRSGDRMFRALYLCDPIERSGTHITREDFVIVDRLDVPPGLKTMRAWDVAISAEVEADLSVGTLGGYYRDELWLLDQVTTQTEPFETAQLILDTMDSDAAADWYDCDTYAIERPLAGEMIMRVLRRMARAKRWKPYYVSVSKRKYLRFSAWAQTAKAKKLKLVRGAWNEPFIKEVLACSFKDGDKDNRIDSVSVLVEAMAMRSGELNEQKRTIEEFSVTDWERFFNEN